MAATVPATILHEDDLPASFRDKFHSLALPCDHLELFLASDLSVDRIELIAAHLWIVGRPRPPRALNLQAVLQRTIVPTTDASLHLVWTPGKIFIKPLARFFFSPAFFEHYLCGDGTNGPALGFLFTYVSLVPTELDFDLAKELHLLPSDSDVTWRSWKALSRRVLERYPGNTIYQCKCLPKRYKYGELRLGRLNKIYRCLGGDWLHGYSNLMGMSTYGQFFAENLGFVTGVTIYVALVLTAMQVGLATPQLEGHVGFLRACYGFAVFSIIGPMVAIAAIAMLFALLFFVNWARTTNMKRAQHSEHENAGAKGISQARNV